MLYAWTPAGVSRRYYAGGTTAITIARTGLVRQFFIDECTTIGLHLSVVFLPDVAAEFHLDLVVGAVEVDGQDDPVGVAQRGDVFAYPLATVHLRLLQEIGLVEIRAMAADVVAHAGDRDLEAAGRGVAAIRTVTIAITGPFVIRTTVAGTGRESEDIFGGDDCHWTASLPLEGSAR